MGKIQKPKEAKLIIGMLSGNKSLFDEVESKLSQRFGEIDLRSFIFPFLFTSYYNDEMGEGLMKMFISFKELILEGELSQIKVFTNCLEADFSFNGKRRINLDPGYITEKKLVLASTKDSYHRIYLSDGIYAEITLYFHKGTFLDLPWTYPDYRKKETKEFFILVRKAYLKQRREISKPNQSGYCCFI